MNDDNYITLNEEGIAEVNPTASSDMQTAFIDNYRQTQGENTAAIGAAAHELGSDLEAPYGGLHGPSEYMKSRYQTPQTESRVAALRTAAQLSALNQLMKNDQARWNEQYNKAYRNAQKRQRAKQNALYSNLGGGGNSSTNYPSGGVEFETEQPVQAPGAGTNAPVEGYSDTSYVDVDGHWHTVYTQGDRTTGVRRIEYIDGQLASDTTSEPATTGGGGSGGGW